MNSGHIWSETELRTLKTDYATKPADISKLQWCATWGKAHGKLSVAAVNGQVNRLQLSGTITKIVKESPYPVYNSPLEMDGDALVLPDLEIPFHNAEFVNRCLDLADKLNIRQCILAGDVMHFDSLSHWDPSWTAGNNGNLNAEAESALMDFAKELSSKQQGKLMGLIGDLGQQTETDGMSTELGVARGALHSLTGLFERIDFVLGNHEGRFLRTLQTAVNPDELLRLLDAPDPKWRIAPYYFSYLDTSRGRYQIEHPRGTAETTAQNLAAKYHVHVLMGHSHLLDCSWDISGMYYAIHMGHCVDELRLPYAAQRHVARRAHKPGAVLVLDGYPWLLHDGTDWQRMAKL